MKLLTLKLFNYRQFWGEVSLELAHQGKRSVTIIHGNNGAGKTTTVRMLSSILKPTRGSARVAGYDVVTQGTDVRQRVGVLTEAPGLYTRMTGQEYQL